MSQLEDTPEFKEMEDARIASAKAEQAYLEAENTTAEVAAKDQLQAANKRFERAVEAFGTVKKV